jgi:hypothetical protein
MASKKTTKTTKAKGLRPGQGLGRGRGRVPLEAADRRSEYVRIRITAAEKATLEDAAVRAKLTLSAYVLQVALRSAREE